MKRPDLSLTGTVFRLAGPTMLEQLMQTAVQYVDTAMVGALGTAATAAVGSTTTVNWLIGSSIGAMGVGFLAIISQARGAGDVDRARRASAQAVLMMLLIGALFTALPLALAKQVPGWMQLEASIRPLASRYFFIIYLPTVFRAAATLSGTLLRSAGDSRTPMAAGILMNLVNVVLNFLLIFPRRELLLFGLHIPMWGAGLGVVGAAAATALSFVLGGVLLLRALWRHKEISPRGYPLKPDKAVLLPCLKIAVPAVLQRFATSLGYVIFASLINSLGEVSTAAHTVANTVESAFYVPGYGMMTAAATLTGEVHRRPGPGAAEKDQHRRPGAGNGADARLRGAALRLCPCHGLPVQPGRTGGAPGRRGAADGGPFRALLRRDHRPGGEPPGSGEHPGAVHIQCDRHVGRAHRGHLPAGDGAGQGPHRRLGCHDRPQSAAVRALCPLSEIRAMEQPDEITRRCESSASQSFIHSVSKTKGKAEPGSALCRLQFPDARRH